jgi:hypothetical protein
MRKTVSFLHAPAESYKATHRWTIAVRPSSPRLPSRSSTQPEPIELPRDPLLYPLPSPLTADGFPAHYYDCR